MASQVTEKLETPPASNRAESPGLAVTDGSDEPLRPSDGEEDDAGDEKLTNYTPSTTSRQFIVKGSSPFGRTLDISNAQGGQIMTCELHSFSKPHIIITSTAGGGASGEKVAEIVFNRMSRRISLTVRGNIFEIQHKGVFQSGYSFQSPTTGEKLEWQGRGTSTLIDEAGNAVAKLETSRLQPWKNRTVEIVGSWADSKGDTATEEVLASALAIIELRRRRSRNAGAGGSGGTGGAGG